MKQRGEKSPRSRLRFSHDTASWMRPGFLALVGDSLGMVVLLDSPTNSGYHGEGGMEHQCPAACNEPGPGAAGSRSPFKSYENR